MRTKRIAGGVGIALVVLAGLAYHLVFGYVTAKQIDDNIAVLTRQNILTQIGANVVVYADQKTTIVVDTQLPPLAASTRSKVDAFAQVPVSKVLITHWHPDHSGGIAAFLGSADVISHENVRRRLSVPQEGFGLTKPGSHHKFNARPESGLPNKTIAADLELTTETGGVDVVHYPKAHTDGDIVVYFRNQNVVVVGDLVWPNSFPFIDGHNGGSVAGLESALRAILSETNSKYRFIPGHGAALTTDDIGAYLTMVSSTRKWVESRLDDGNTVSQIVESGLPDEWKKWGSALVPPREWIESVQATRAR